MSLVDYASSSEDDREEDIEEQKEDDPKEPDPLSPSNIPNRSLMASLQQPPDRSSHISTPHIETLPDASLLLNSPAFSAPQLSGGDHSSRVAAAMAESASRKRESNGSVSSYPQSKHPRGNLQHSRNVPDTGGGLLVPPQLNGRSNVVTEDIGKLFVRRPSDPAR
eukprot:TRINITY_DN9703_c0_g1_i1.p1 TRINITY_DN9703_c0_g1~~TRINITY_DN9703_c0_g1_i1.p1  ORF type:complete len:165 (+),score=29.78 TRINITY_DN9703_c0_g1_i1:50-544(+)